MTLTSSEDVEPCGGTVEFLDRFAPHVYSYWTGAPIPDDFGATVDLRRSSPMLNRGLQTSRDFAWVSDQLALVHEVSHLVVVPSDGSSASVFLEGVAEVLGPTYTASGWGPVFDHPESFAFLPRSDFEARHYSPAAKLMGSLIHRYGVETVRNAYQTARSDNTAEEIEAVFVEVFGDGIYDAFDEHMEEEQCGLQAWECSEDVVPLGDLPLVVERSADCASDPAFIGATADEDENWYPSQRLLVDIAEETVVRIDTTDNAAVRRELCLSSCTNLPDDVVLTYVLNPHFGVTVFTRPWSAGRYTITVRPIDTTKPFSASIDVVE